MRMQDGTAQRENYTGSLADLHEGTPTYSVQKCLQRPNLFLLVSQEEAMSLVDKEYEIIVQRAFMMVVPSKCDSEDSNPDLTCTPPWSRHRRVAYKHLSDLNLAIHRNVPNSLPCPRYSQEERYRFLKAPSLTTTEQLPE